MTRLRSMRRFASGLSLLALSGGVAWFIVSGRIMPGSPKTEGTAQTPSAVETRGPTRSRGARASSERGVYPFNRVVVVAVGINRYESLTGTADLRFAEADARAFADLTRDAYGYESETILGSEATKVGIERTLERYGQELGDQDALIVFFAGHGQVIELPESGEAGYLIPADARLDINSRTDADRWATEALDMQYLTELIEGMGARHVLFIADACASGFMTKRGSLERWDLKTFLFDRSRTVLTAT